MRGVWCSARGSGSRSEAACTRTTVCTPATAAAPVWPATAAEVATVDARVSSGNRVCTDTSGRRNARSAAICDFSEK